MIKGHITDIDPVRDDFTRNGIPRSIAAVEITVQISVTDLQKLNLRHPITITQEEDQ